MSVTVISVGGNSINLISTPTTPALRSVQWGAADAVALVTSVFTGQSQAQQWPGADMWSGTMTLPPLTVAQMNDWIAFLMQARGMANAFQLIDPLRASPRGSASGSPMVDNTVAGGNAAGSQTLGTKGWTPGANGVLLRGDLIQVGFRLYTALDDVDADGNGNALIPIWPSLREQPTNDGTSALWLNATAALAMVESGVLNTWFWGASWSDFTTPSLPSDAVIQGIYPVLICAFVKDGTNNSGAWCGPTMDIWGDSPGGAGFGSFGASFSSEIYGASIGASLSLLAGNRIGARLGCSLSISSMSDTLSVTAVGFAIYYTSATPTTDTQIAAPFTVPSGQGVAWSLPTAALAGPSPGPANNGSASATAAINNGGLILNNATGLWRLGNNKRSWAYDFTKMTSISFPIQEYR